MPKATDYKGSLFFKGDKMLHYYHGLFQKIYDIKNIKYSYSNCYKRENVVYCIKNKDGFIWKMKSSQ